MLLSDLLFWIGLDGLDAVFAFMVVVVVVVVVDVVVAIIVVFFYLVI